MTNECDSTMIELPIRAARGTSERVQGGVASTHPAEERANLGWYSQWGIMMRLADRSLIVLMFLYCSDVLSALPADTWQYCSTDYSAVRKCFGSLDEAEAWMRKESPTNPNGRKFLELSGDPAIVGSANNPSEITYSYSVRPRPPTASYEDYTRSISKFVPSIGVACGCREDGSNEAECLPYGADTNCSNTPGNCYSCELQGGNIEPLKGAMLSYLNEIGCNAKVVNETSWPDPPNRAAPLTGINNKSFPINTGQFFYYNNGEPVYYPYFIPFNKYVDFSYNLKQNGQCTTILRETSQHYERISRFECDIGLRSHDSPINLQDHYSPSQVIPVEQICSCRCGNCPCPLFHEAMHSTDPWWMVSDMNPENKKIGGGERCIRCGRNVNDQRSQAYLLLNPVVWLFFSPLYAGRYCDDCIGFIGFISYILLGSVLVFLVIILFILV